MSRSGYSDDCDGWELIRWRGAVNSALRGRRGQTLLRDLVAALDALPEKRLVTEELVQDGCYCALGAVGRYRGLSDEELASIDPENREQVAAVFDIAGALAAEIVYENDEMGSWTRQGESPERRWSRIRAWAVGNLND